MTDSLHDRVTAALGQQYRIEDEIGRGGMSVVYRARDLRLNRLVAVKVLPPELAYDAAVGSRFTREAQTSAQLSHPHIAPIYDVGERNGIAYFVMALIAGPSVATLLEQHPLRPVDEVRRILAEVADALSYAHLRGVIHRDIKADNILLDAESGRAIVTDFGIARAVDGGTRLTQTGSAVGTPTYMSPEQATGEREIDGRSDIYSLGVLGYQMLAGRVPFTAANPMALLLKHVSERPRPVAELRPEAPAGLCMAIDRALAKRPDDRWPTAASLRDALLTAELPAPVPAWRAEPREPVRYKSPTPRSRGAALAAPPRDGFEPPRPTMRAAVIGSGGIVLEPAHLAGLTAWQREDLRLWSGRVSLFDRVKGVRRYALATIAMSVLGVAGFIGGVSEVPPLVLSPIVPLLMMVTLHRRNRSLRESGLSLRRVYTALRTRSVLPAPAPLPTERQLEKLAPREVLDGPQGPAIRRAAEDRAAIVDIVRGMSKADRAMLPEIEPTVNALLDRVVNLAMMLHRLGSAADRAMESELESAAVALENLRTDIVRLRTSSAESALFGASSATQQARALSREIALALDAAAEIRDM